MYHSVIFVVTAVTIASATGTLLRCSEQSFSGLGGALPSSSSSSKYSICSSGIVHEVTCPSRHSFDASSGTCIKSHESTQAAVVDPSRQFEELCTNPNEVQILPNPTNCSMYIICFGLVPIEQSCGNGLLFNPELEVCDIPTNVICGYSCPNVDDPYNPVWLPDARLEDCSRHYLCFQGNPIRFFCSNNLYFDVVSNTCTYPQYSDCSVPGVYCNANGTEVVQNPRSCTSYYACLEGYPHFRSCPDGEYFSSEVRRCVVGTCPPQTGTTTTIQPTSTVDMNTATTSITSTVDWNTSSSIPDSTTTAIISTSPSVVPTTEQSTTGLPTTPTLSTPQTTSPETTTHTPNTSSTLSPTTTTTGIETTNVATTIEAIPSTTDVISTTNEATTDTTTYTTASTTTVEPVATTTELFTPTESSSTSEIMSSSEATTPSTTESATTTDIISTTESLSTTDATTITESTSTSDGTPTTEAVTTLSTEATTSTTTELTTTTEVTPTEVTPSEIATTTTETATTIDPSEFCQGITSAVFPYPGNCYQYILCLNSLGIVSECAANQIFNSAQGICVTGDRNTCILG